MLSSVKVFVLNCLALKSVDLINLILKRRVKLLLVYRLDSHVAWDQIILGHNSLRVSIAIKVVYWSHWLDKLHHVITTIVSRSIVSIYSLTLQSCCFISSDYWAIYSQTDKSNLIKFVLNIWMVFQKSNHKKLARAFNVHCFELPRWIVWLHVIVERKMT